MRILLLAPHPFFQARGTPIAVKAVLEFLCGRGHAVDVLTFPAEFLGPRPLTLLPGLLRQAEVLVSPRVKGLNTPMKIYSYLDSATPVLATRLPTHTQVLDEGTAFLVEPEPSALGRGLARLLQDGRLRQMLARNAKAYVQREFTPQAAERKLEAFYSAIEARVAERSA